MSLLFFEIKKILLTKRIRLFAFFSFLLVIILFCFNSYMSYQENQQISANNLENILQRDSYSGDIKEYLEELNNGILAQEEAFIDAAGKGKDISEELTLPTYPPFRIALNEELMDKQLPPYSLRYGTKNTIFSVILITYIASLAGVICFLLFFGELFSSEIEKKHIQFLFCQPIKRYALFFIKFFLMLVLSIFSTIGLTFLGFVMTSFLSGKASLSYPIITFTELSMKLIPAWQYIGQVFLLFCFVLAFAVACYFLFCLILKKTYLSLAATSIFLIEGNIISTMKQPFLNKFAHFNPFTYLNAGKIFVGYDFMNFEQYAIENQEYYANYCVPRVLHNNQINLTNGIVTLTIAALVFLSIAFICFKKNAHRSIF